MTYEELKKRCSELEAENEELKRTIEDKELKIEHLTELLLKRNKMLFGQKSEKGKYVDDGQMTLDGDVFNEAETESNPSAPEPTENSVTKRKSRKTGKHRGRVELRNDLEEKKVVYDIPENERICDVCGEPLTEMTEELLTTRLCIIPEKVYLVKYYRKVYKCKNCDMTGIKSNIVKAENKTPACIIEKGLPDASMVAYVMGMKYLLGTPLYRMEQYFKMQGIYLNRTSLANWVIAGAKWFAPVVRKFWEYAYLEPILNADETVIRVLKIKGEKVKKNGQMWVVCTGTATSRKIAIYTFRDSRTKETAEELLGDYTGIVQTDGLQSYGSGDYQNVGCWAHARRKFADSIPEGVKNSKAAQALKILEEAFLLEAKAREDQFSPEQILKMRQEEVKPIIEKFYAFIGELNPGKKTHLGEAVTYALNQKEKLTAFLDDPKIEMTNNLAERTVKPFVIARKNFLFSATDKGADASAAVMTIIETAKRNELDVYQYLKYLLTVLPQWGTEPTDTQLDSVMPWSLVLPPECRKTYSEIQ